jgi:hypothetical protein
MPKLRSRRKSSKRKRVRRKSVTRKSKSKRKSVRRKSKSKRKTSKRVSRKRLSKLECLDLLKSKIGINMREFPNRKQAIAVSYSQVKKYQPNCARFFK